MGEMGKQVLYYVEHGGCISCKSLMLDECHTGADTSQGVETLHGSTSHRG